MGRMDGENDSTYSSPQPLELGLDFCLHLVLLRQGLVIAPAGFKLFLGSPGLNLNFQFPISVSRDLANL